MFNGITYYMPNGDGIVKYHGNCVWDGTVCTAEGDNTPGATDNGCSSLTMDTCITPCVWDGSVFQYYT